jgi:ABC-type uncharacterized transport system involved in gliding motility auxiliary subunit
MRRAVNLNRYYRFILYVIVVVLVNVAGATLFFRIDLTKAKAYSLSRASKEAVATLSEPLTVKVFFTSNLPAPYNNIDRYLGDLLQEYAVAGNRYFNYEFHNVSGEDDEARQNQEVARNYGIFPVQIQKIEQDEVKFQTAHMGIVLIHGDVIETIPTITSTEGLEFQITSTIRKMNNKISALLGLKDTIDVKLFLSSSLQVVGPYMNLTGLSEVPEKIEHLIDRLNEKNYGKLAFSHLDPSRDGAHVEEAKRYNILSLRWDEFKDRMDRSIRADEGFAGIIVEHGGKSEEIPLIRVVQMPIFGTQYILGEMEELERDINDTVENIIDVNEKTGYLADHRTHPLETTQTAPGIPGMEPLSKLGALLSKEYTVTPVKLKEEGIPEGLRSLIIAGPREPFSDYELYQIDQFLMKGRNLAIFMDRFEEIMPQRNMMMAQGQGPTSLPLDTGLEKLLAHYGVTVKKSYIMDENCFKQSISRAFGGGERPIYFAPIIKSEFINKDVSFLKNIKGLVMLKTSPVEIEDEKIKEAGLKAEKLFSSSERSWEMAERINLNPMFMQPPTSENAYRQMAIAYTLEGSFPSYFADRPLPVREVAEEGKRENPKGALDKEKGVDTSPIESAGTTIKTGKPGKIFLIGTSEILKNNIIDDEGKSPNAQFIMNVIDYVNDREENAVMRTKAQRFNPLMEVRPGTRTFIKTANIAGLPVIVVLAGLVVLFRRKSRKRVVQEMFGKE